MYRNNWTHQHENKVGLSQNCSYADFIHSQFVSNDQTFKLSTDTTYRYSTIRARGHRNLKKIKSYTKSHTSKQNCSNWYLKSQEYASTILCYFIHQSTGTVKKKETKNRHYVTWTAVQSQWNKIFLGWILQKVVSYL